MNQTLDYHIKELSKSREQYNSLFEKFKKSNQLFNERDNLNQQKLKYLNSENELMKTKISELKRVVKSQKQASSIFEKDFLELEEVANVLESRENELESRYLNLLKNMSMVKESKEDLETELEKLKSLNYSLKQLISEMIPRSDYEICLSRLQDLDLKIVNEMVPLVKYNALQNVMDNNMVSRRDYESLLNTCNSLQMKIEIEMVPALLFEDLSQSLNDAYDRIKTLEDNNARLEKENTSSKHSLIETEERISSLKARIFEAEREISLIRQENDDKREQIEILKDQSLTIDTDRSELNARILVLESSKASLLTQLGNSKQKCRRDVEQHFSTAEENNILKSQLASANAVVKDGKAVIKDLTLQFTDVTAALASCKEDSSVQLAMQSRALSEAEAQAGKLSSQYQSSAKECKAMKRHIEELKTKLIDANEWMEKHKVESSSELASRMKTIEDLSTRFTHSCDANKAFTHEIDDLKAKLLNTYTSTELRTADSSNQLQTQARDIACLENQLKHISSENSELIKTNGDMKKENELLKNRFFEAENVAHGKLIAEIERLAHESAQLKASLADASGDRQRLASLVEENKAMRESNAEISQRLQFFQCEMDEVSVALLMEASASRTTSPNININSSISPWPPAPPLSPLPSFSSRHMHMHMNDFRLRTQELYASNSSNGLQTYPSEHNNYSIESQENLNLNLLNVSTDQQQEQSPRGITLKSLHLNTSMTKPPSIEIPLTDNENEPLGGTANYVGNAVGAGSQHREAVGVHASRMYSVLRNAGAGGTAAGSSDSKRL